MKIKIPHDLRNFVNWFFIRTITTKAKEVAGNETANFKNVPGWEKMGSQDVDIKLTINGVECDFMETIMSLDKNLDQFVLEKAQDLIKENVGKFQETLEDMQRVALQGIGRMANELGVELRDSNYR